MAGQQSPKRPRCESFLPAPKLGSLKKLMCLTHLGAQDEEEDGVAKRASHTALPCCNGNNLAGLTTVTDGGTASDLNDLENDPTKKGR